MRFQILSSLAVMSLCLCCSPSSSSNAIAFLWNDEPLPESSKIMVISEKGGETLRNEAVTKLESLGFVIENSSEELIITEPKILADIQVIFLLEMEDNAIILSADQAPLDAEDEDDWIPVKMGDSEFGSEGWDLMEVMAHAVDHTSLRYN